MVWTTPDFKMSLKRYMEIGRVALVNYSKDYGKFSLFVDVIDQNQTAIGTYNMVRSQMNFMRWSPISRLKLVVSLSEIGLLFIPVSQYEIGTIVNFDLDRSISLVPSPSSDDALINL